jgi:hypothetical protein
MDEVINEVWYRRKGEVWEAGEGNCIYKGKGGIY